MVLTYGHFLQWLIFTPAVLSLGTRMLTYKRSSLGRTRHQTKSYRLQMTASNIHMRKIKEENEYTYLTIPLENSTAGVISSPSSPFAFASLQVARMKAIAIHMPFSAKNRPGQILHYPNQINSLHDRGEPRSNLLPNPNTAR